MEKIVSEKGSHEEIREAHDVHDVGWEVPI
jgi:hypothetical protein